MVYLKINDAMTSYSSSVCSIGLRATVSAAARRCACVFGISLCTSGF